MSDEVNTFLGTLSLRGKLFLWVMPILILGLLSLSLGAYWSINNLIVEELTKSMLLSTGKSAESINRWLATIMLEPETIASTPAAKHINRDFHALDLQNINRHKILHAKHPDIFQDIYAANSKGEYHTVRQQGEGYTLFIGDISNRDYFRSIMSGGPTQITPPLISRTTGIPTIFMVSPITDDEGRPQGLIGAGISLKYIQQIAEGLKAGRTGYGFIIAGEGTFIYHPIRAFVMQRKITEQDEQTMRELGKFMISGAAGVYRYWSQDRRMVAFYQPIPITGWSVATVLPESELFEPAVTMMRLLAVITIVTIIFVGAAIVLSMRRLTQPIQTVAAHAREIARGNLDVPPLKVRTADEVGVLAQAFNIMTDNLKATMAGLRESEAKYRSIFENTLEGIFQTSLEGRVLNANPALARMLGHDSTADMIAAYADIRSELYVNPDERTRIITALKERGELHNQEVQFYRRDGGKIWVSVSAYLVRNLAGEPLYIEGILSDITERKHSEKEREALHEQLAQAQKLEAVGQLAGGVAHDFNNMLSVILGRTELALLKADPSDPLSATFREIRKAAEHSASLTRQLLAFARKQTIAPRQVDLNQAIGGTLNMLHRLIGEDIDLVWLPGDALWTVNIDPAQIDQLLTNLCLNARDAIQGVGRITIETRNATFDEGYCSNLPGYLPGEYVSLSVSDSGCGMDKETQSHIFEPFFTTKGKDKGTGLGLATVYGIVKQNGGFINIYSEVEQGSIFRVYFPRFTGTAAALLPDTVPDFTICRQETILLVEDEPMLLDLSRQMLEELGYEVLVAGAADEAIRLAESHAGEIHLLMTDVVMPKMNGRDLAAKITEIKPGIRCLFMSGYTANIIAHRGVLDEGVNFIQKPFSIHVLAAKVQEVLTQPKDAC